MSIEEQQLDALEPEQIAELLHRTIDTLPVEGIIQGLGFLVGMEGLTEYQRRVLIRSLALQLAQRVMEPGYITEEPECPTNHPSAI